MHLVARSPWPIETRSGPLVGRTGGQFGQLLSYTRPGGRLARASRYTGHSQSRSGTLIAIMSTVSGSPRRR